MSHRRYGPIILAGILGVPTAAFAQRDFSGVSITAEPAGAGLYMLTGSGGNIGVIAGDDGAIIIDDQFAPLAPKIAEAIDKLPGSGPKWVLNTHWHGDHTGGNAAFAEAGALIVAHDSVRDRLAQGLTRENGDVTQPAVAAALPTITFSDEMTFHWNGHAVALRHFPNAHTDGDAVVFVDGGAVIHMGDLFMNGFFAYIDLESGGDVDGYISAQRAVLEVAPADR